MDVEDMHAIDVAARILQVSCYIKKKNYNKNFFIHY